MYTYLTYNSVLPNTVFTWTPPTWPLTKEVWADMVAGGGAGMSSQLDMAFNDTSNPIPYSRYGGMGGSVCLDTDAPVQVHYSDGRISWLDHPMRQSQGFFFENASAIPGLMPRFPYFAIGNNTEIFPDVFKMTPNAFYFSTHPYAPPGGPHFPCSPILFPATTLILLTPFRLTMPGSMGGGPIGDQSGPQAAILPSDGLSYYTPGKSGSCLEGAGGPGGDSDFGWGAIPQQGTGPGNDGGDPGGGGSGGGMGTPATPVRVPTCNASGEIITGSTLIRPYSMASQVGPGGGAGGGHIHTKLPLKQYYNYFCGDCGKPASAGPGGWSGGRGGYSMIRFREIV